MPSELRKALLDADQSDKALHAAEKILFQDRMFRSLVGTTQAIDLISGGVKTNALPESAWAVVNHRIATDRFVFCHQPPLHRLTSPCSSLEEVKERDTQILKSLAAKFNLSYSAFGEDVTDSSAKSYGKLAISDAFHAGLQPAPLTPTDKDAVPYQLLSGTIRATYDAHRRHGGDEVIVSPGNVPGNTGTSLAVILTTPNTT